MRPEVARNLIDVWSRKREQYPGWVILPFENRHALWHQTEQWIGPILESLAHLSPPDDLLLLYELNWRLERALTTINSDWLPAYEAVVRAYNPFPRYVQSESARVRPDSENRAGMDWKQAGDRWVELVLALARKAREVQDERAFQYWIELVRGVAPLNPEWQARWYFEQGLFHLSRFDRDGVLRILDEWPAQELSFWEGRRTSLLAEFGETADARRAAEAILSDIRSRQQPYIIDLSLLSQEGWMMLQLFAIDFGGIFGGHEEDVRQDRFRLRWAALKSYGCDPWTELNELKEEVRSLEAEATHDREVVKGFDPHRATYGPRYYTESLFIRRRPAFALLRLFEEAAIPMRVGSGSMAGDDGGRAGRLIAPFSPLWALSAMVRSQYGNVLSDWFDRIRVAKLPDEDVSRLYTILTDAFTQALRYLSENPQEARTMTTFYATTLDDIVELLSRLSFRLPPTELDALLRRAVEVYGSPLLRSQAHLYKVLNPLFERIIYAMPNSGLLSRLDLLLSLPIPFERGAEVPIPDWVPEPMSDVEFTDEFKIREDYDRSAWNQSIDTLVGIVRNGTPQGRQRATLRLIILADIGGLSDEQELRFREALWSQLDDRGLPAHTNLYIVNFLRHPRPGTDTTKEDIRQYILSDAVPRNYQYFTEVTNLTARVNAKEGDRETLIDWRPDEAALLLNRAVEWWDGVEAMTSTERQRKYSLDLKRRAVEIFHLLQFLSVVVFPRLAEASDDVKVAAAEILYRVERSGFSIHFALPALLFVAPARYELVARKMREGLNSLKEDETRDAVKGTYRWLLHSAYGEIKPPPDDLFAELINKVTFRRQPALLSAIAQVAIIVKELPQLINPETVVALTTGLQYLLIDTELPNEVDRETVSDFRFTIPFEERPNLRAAAAGLAYRLFILLSGKNQEVPEVINRWREVSMHDPLPEVRRAWH